MGLPAPASRADEIAMPSGGSFAMEGHGWGHGHGMSQWGAQGAASLGKTADQIMSFYYPGTAKTALANSAVRVLLSNGPGAQTQVYPATGLAVVDLATGAKATLPSGPTRWRSVTDVAGLHLQYYASGWKQYALAGRTVFSGPLQFDGPPVIRLVYSDGTSRDYRGSLRSVRGSSTAVTTVNVLPMESYLRGVVPRESSSSWAPAALQAQAIAARTYTAVNRGRYATTRYYDICDTTQCQVYGGATFYSTSGSPTALEPASTNDAISATVGIIRTYQGKPIFAQFSSSDGGWTSDGGYPYLPAQADPWDGAVSNSVHSWTATVTSAQIQARYPSVGTLVRLRVTLRDGNGEWGGRVKAVVLEGVDAAGKATSVTTTGVGIYNANPWPQSSTGLRSSWWHVKTTTDSSIVSQSAAPTLVRSPGVSTGTLSVTLRNTGTTPWSTTGLHLAVASPPGQADPLVGGSTRPGVYTGAASTIAPGGTAAFRFDLTGDGVAPGVQARSYRLRNGMGALYGAVVSWKVPVAVPLFTATAANPPLSLASRPASSPVGAPGPVFADGRTIVVPSAGSTALRLSTTKTGNLYWPVRAAVRLGTSGPRERTSISSGPGWLSGTRPAVLGGSTQVAPHGTGTFDLTLYGGGHPVGVTQEAFEPVWDGKHWLDGSPTTLVVVRVNPAVSRAATVEQAPPTLLALTTAPSGRATLTVRLRNVGGSPWDVGTEPLVAGATDLATPAWSSSTTPPALAANVNRPGQAKVYPGEIGEWRVPLSAYRKNAGVRTLSLQAKGTSGVYGPRMSTSVTVSKAVFTGTLTKVSAPGLVPRYGTAVMSFEVKNTGNIDWGIGSGVRSESLTLGGSPSYAPNWLTASRPGPVGGNVSRPGANAVRPGEVARFYVVIAGNGRAPQSRSEAFDVVYEAFARIPIRAVLSYRVV